MSFIPQLTGLLYSSTLPKYDNIFSPHIWVKILYVLHVNFTADFSLFEIYAMKCITWIGVLVTTDSLIVPYVLVTELFSWSVYLCSDLLGPRRWK